MASTVLIFVKIFYQSISFYQDEASSYLTANWQVRCYKRSNTISLYTSSIVTVGTLFTHKVLFTITNTVLVFLLCYTFEDKKKDTMKRARKQKNKVKCITSIIRLPYIPSCDLPSTPIVYITESRGQNGH